MLRQNRSPAAIKRADLGVDQRVGCAAATVQQRCEEVYCLLRLFCVHRLLYLVSLVGKYTNENISCRNNECNGRQFLQHTYTHACTQTSMMPSIQRRCGWCRKWREFTNASSKRFCSSLGSRPTFAECTYVYTLSNYAEKSATLLLDRRLYY